MTQQPSVPVLQAFLFRLRPQFPLPRAIGPNATLLPIQHETSASRSSERVNDKASHVLSIHGLAENRALSHAINIVSTMRLASRCGFAVIEYATQDITVGADEAEHASLWGHYDEELTVDSIGWVEEHLDALAPFHAAEKFSRLGNALRLYDAAMRARNCDLALLGFVGALESLFSIAPQELSFRLSFLLGRFLGDDVDAQRQYFRRAKSLYTVRSKIAHGDKLHDREEATAIALVETWTPEAEELARESLWRVFDRNLIGIFNSKRLHETFLTDLFFEASLDATIAKNSASPGSGV